MKTTFKLFLILLLLAIYMSSYAASDQFQCREKIVMLTNLKSVSFLERFSISTSSQRLLEKTNGNAYLISMPLLVSAMLGEQEHYQQALSKMKKAMQSDDLSDSSQNSFKAWLYGRMLLAAKSINDPDTESQGLSQLEALLANKNTKQDRFMTWALGYQAASKREEYFRVKKDLKNGADRLTHLYATIKNGSASDEKKQETKGDALWAWVMVLQAAALANDIEFYHYALKQMQFITQQQKISDALLIGLRRTAASNDYPAWALAITRLSAITIGDQALFTSLGVSLDQAIKTAKQSNIEAEVILAQVNNQLAIEREKMLMKCEIKPIW